MAITVTNSELHESEQNTFEEKSGSATRNLLCAGENADLLCSQAMGGLIQVGQTQVWYPPASHPRRPWLYVKSCSYVPFGKSWCEAGISYWEFAKVTLQYSTLEEEQRENGPYITESRQGGTEAMTLQGKQWVWESDSKPIGNTNEASTFQILLPIVNLSYTIHRWIDPPFDTFDSSTGKVNGENFRILWNTYPAESLLFLSYSSTRNWTEGEELIWNVSLDFTFKRQGWNTFYRTSEGAAQFERVVVDGGSATPYETMDFGLFLP